MTNASGAIVRNTKYCPYGAVSETSGTKDTTRKFTGHILDDDTGLYYCNARYYDPVLGTFITADDIIQDQYDPQSLNRYAYCRNNPIRYTDPSGHFWELAAKIAYSLVTRSFNVGTRFGDGSGGSVTRSVGTGLRETVNPLEYNHSIIGFRSTLNGLSRLSDGIDYLQNDILIDKLGISPVNIELCSATFAVFGGELFTGARAAAEAVECNNVLKSMSVITPYGKACQSLSEKALLARKEVQQGSVLYKIGTIGKSEIAESQFWSLEHPLSVNFSASRYGIPTDNFKLPNFIISGKVKSGTSFVTREAPAVGPTLGGNVEVVVPKNGVVIESFNMIEK
jgi:RHS repeat-associated protein